MGWFIAFMIALLAFGGLVISGKCSRLALEIAAAMLLLGLAGYGWQGSPDMAENPIPGTSQ